MRPDRSDWIGETAAVDAAAYLDHIAADGTRLGAAARSAPEAAVPSCPEWDMAGLVRHQAAIHHWVIGLLDTMGQTRPKRWTGPEPWDELINWFDAGVAGVVDRLGSMDEDAPVWNWWDDAPAPARFWRRRMAHETSVHRWDGEAAAGVPSPIAAELAADGIDEWLLFCSRLPDNPRPASSGELSLGGLAGTMRVRATDVDRAWTVELMPRGVVPFDGDPELVVEGPASDVELWLLNRLPLSAVSATGDATVADRWRAVTF